MPRIIKNYTSEDVVIHDLGDIVVPANGALDLGDSEQRLIELANSDDLLTLLAKGTMYFQINDGTKNYDFAEGIDLIRRITFKPKLDAENKMIIRIDSKPKDYTVTFMGSGDDVENRIIGGGKHFVWDFANNDDLVEAPTGYKRKRIDYQFIHGVHLKDGTLYFFNAPQGTYIDMYILCPPGYYYSKKFFDYNTGQVTRQFFQHTGSEPLVIAHWVVNYHIEGSCPMGDELNTESADEYLLNEYFILRSEITAPDTAELANFHGHFTLEMYRATTILWD